MSKTTQNAVAEYKKKFPDLPWTKLKPVGKHPFFKYPGFAPDKKTLLGKGHTKHPGKRPFISEVIYEHDVAIQLRDGTKIFTDVFRPSDSEVSKVPVIIAWSPYGKTGSGVQRYETMGPFSCGVSEDTVSGYEKFEGPDPADWCPRGYAILNPDTRGATMSEGDITFCTESDALDLYDTLEWLTLQPWCNGSVGMMGNSWLAIHQLNFASRLKHPTLKALAPMEAATDPYRDIAVRGGRPHLVGFNNLLLSGFCGPNSAENFAAMVRKRPLYDDYWASKHGATENVDIPLYLTASYSSCLHTYGSFRTFTTAKTKEKWLRVHPYQEWSDLYRPEIVDELQRYFDRYLNGTSNGWENDIPAVRISLLGFDGSPAKTVVERTEAEYPLARQQLTTYRLDASSHTLTKENPPRTSTTSHNSHSLDASSDFILHFDDYTEIAGSASVCLWMSCDEHDDMDVAVQIRKIDKQGNLLQHLNYKCPVPVQDVPDVNIAKTLGPQGFLRVSHTISRDFSVKDEIYYRHDRREPIKPGSVVPVEIQLWPMGMVFAPGEGIMLRISGHDMCLPEISFLKLAEPDDDNVGDHKLYTGGEYDSTLILPVIPPAK
ncbi:uncharacterized protein A1O5_07717 [Cladophialophora psammophila CBS 110553]|uniref:Xaa-Pro dipeptidyl-peptidase C-terminal domain-containing protein n=1 Tax=Cladophialophora psammophila CBS 110553 TaxID=1182543 RepID=W9WVV5_9EURO|nr:uncharacterized protein A1O5_07717 [Cladophialophora psammophila CBS 110553]EXJ68786.1 hypothetical protein A1O5_07717 [Cladophialophora psammophila CBS 110553]